MLMSLPAALVHYARMSDIITCFFARADLINSEMSGVAFSSVNQCFRQPDLKRMFETSPPITCPHGPDVLVCVDPCAGGEHSVRARGRRTGARLARESACE